jgi:hypothetical protein
MQGVCSARIQPAAAPPRRAKHLPRTRAALRHLPTAPSPNPGPLHSPWPAQHLATALRERPRPSYHCPLITMSRLWSSKRLQVAYLLVVSLAGFVLRITVSRAAMWIWLLAVAVLLVGLSVVLHRRSVSKPPRAEHDHDL